MMTPEEHSLVIAILARQFQQGKTFIEILKSRGILEGDDPLAFASTVYLDPASNSALWQQAKEDYLQLAKMLGVQTGLESAK
ncbi:MAG: hypothetical protein WBX03_13380 [Terriglobales bacterium]|jgi:hypothetical protein